MKNLTLAEITTKDGLIHQGIYVEPPKKSTTALLFVHGLTSAFYHQLPLQDALIEMCRKEGYGYASFNNRGHDFVTSTYKIDDTSPKGKRHVTIGGGVETFADSIWDIEAGISFLEHQGYTSIILVGHSTGANKVCHYIATERDKRIRGVVFLSPINDRLNPVIPHKKIGGFLLRMLIALGLGDRLFSNLTYFPITPRRAFSLLTPQSIEDTFPYDATPFCMPHVSSIKIPLLVLLGEMDEYRDRPIKKIQQAFDAVTQSSQYMSTIIPDATHGFDGKEHVTVTRIMDWIKTMKL